MLERMRITRILLISGVWIAVLPYLGFPIFWKNILITLTGLGAVYLGYLLYKKEKTGTAETYDNFSENREP